MKFCLTICRGIARCGVFILSIIAVGSLAGGDTFEWTNPTSGVFTTSTNWTNITGTDSAPPNAGDVARFNEAGTYTVTMSLSPVASDLLQVTAGDVTFKENVIGFGIFNLTTGQADAMISGGNLTLGTFNDPSRLNIGDDLSVGGGSSLNVNFASRVDVGDDVFLGLGGNGTLILDGNSSTLDVSDGVSMGSSGGIGTLTFQNGTTANQIGGLLRMISGSGVAGSTGRVNVLSGSAVDTASIVVGDSNSGSVVQEATITVNGSGSLLNMTGASTLTIGDDVNANITAQVLIENNGVLNTGTGNILIRNSGNLNVSGGGDVNVNGLLTLDGASVDATITGTNSTLNAAGQNIIMRDGADLSVESSGNMTAANLTIESAASGTSSIQILSSATADVANVSIGESGTGTSQAFWEVGAGTNVTADNISIATTTSATRRGALQIDGTLSQNGNATLSVGADAANLGQGGRIDLFDDGVLNTGTGLTRIDNTGLIVSFGGAVNFNGDVIVDNGTYEESPGGDATHTRASGTSLTITNGGLFITNVGFLRAEGGGTVTLDGASSQLSFTTPFNSLSVGGFSDPTSSTLTLSNGFQQTVDAVSMRAQQTGQVATLNVLSGADLIIDGASQFSLLGSDTGNGQILINLDGPGSNLIVQEVFSAPKLGQDSGMGTTAEMNITNNARFTSDDEGLIVNPLGTVQLANGRIDMFGDLLVQGGTLATTSGTDGVVSLSGFAGIGVEVTEGGMVELNQSVFALDGNRLVVDGPGSSFSLDSSDINDGQIWMSSFTGTPDAEIRLSNTAMLDVGILNIATAGSGNEVNRVSISSGSTATTSHLGVGTFITDDGAGFFDVSFSHAADLTIEGPGSSLTVRPGHDAYIGSPEIDAVTDGRLATVTLTDGGELNTSGSDLFITHAGIVNLNGGTLNAGTIDYDIRGQFNFNSGTLSTTNLLRIDNAELLGPVVDLTDDKHLATTSSTIVSSIGSLTLNGGSLTTSNLSVGTNGILEFNAGTLNLTGSDITVGAGGLLGATVTLGADKTLSVGGDAFLNAEGQLDMEGGSFAADNFELFGHFSFDGGQLNINSLIDVKSSGRIFVKQTRSLVSPVDIDNGGRIELLGSGARLQGSSSLNNAGLITGDGQIDMPLSNFSSGEIRVAFGKTLSLTGALGNNQGLISLQGGTLETSSSLTNAAAGNIVGRGALNVGGAGLTNQGDLALSNGQTDVFGDLNNETTGRVIVSGNADVTFWDDVANTGTLFNVSAGSSATFFGSAGFGISGGGDVFFEADVTPGSSPGLETFGGNVHFGILSILEIEIEGLTSGSEFDTLDISGMATLNGTLDVSLLSGFNPTNGDSFEILAADGGITGTFVQEILPALSGNLEWNILYGTNNVVLEVLAALAADTEPDGDVDGADFLTLQRNNPSLISAWQTEYGTTPSLASSQNVPEPAPVVFILLMFAVVSPLRIARHL